MLVAHISDLHLRSIDGIVPAHFLNKRLTGGANLLLNRGRHYRPEVFDRMVQDINDQKVEQVVCTGDVTNLSLDSEFRVVRAALDRIAIGPDNVTCVPGNHDAYVPEARRSFVRHLGPYCSRDALLADVAPDADWPCVRLRGPVAIIGLSSAVVSGWFRAFGVIGESQLMALRRVLLHPEVRSRFRLVLVHHPPLGHGAEKRLSGLRDREALVTILKQEGVDLVLHGHLHLAERNQLRGPDGQVIPIRGTQSATYDALPEERRSRYRIYCVEERDHKASLTSVRVRKFEEEKFVEEEVEDANQVQR